MRAEHTGNASGDRAQRMAQQVSQSHEITKELVQALANYAYAELAADVTLGASAGVYSDLLTVNLATSLPSGSLTITFSTSSTHVTNTGSNYFRVMVDGVAKRGAYATIGTLNFGVCALQVLRVPVTAGNHVVKLQWSTDFSSARINAKSSVAEHANLLVQEGA